MSKTHHVKMVTALFHDRDQAVIAYDWLLHHGHPARDISVLMSDKVAPSFAAETDVDRAEQKQLAARGAQSTGAIGAGLAMVVAAGLGSIIAGIGLATGPLGVALAASIPGAMVGGLIGGLVGYGFPEASAKQYEHAVQNGAVAIGVAPRHDEDLLQIERKFAELDGEDMLRF